MGKVEDDRRRGFVLEVLFKGEVAFKDTDGCGYRTDERVIYRPASSAGLGKRVGRNTDREKIGIL
jgi:hypothetical protein